MSLFGGMVDAGEASVAAAHRELAEESGLHSDELMPWFSQPLFGSIEWQLDYFVARNCAQVGVQKLDAGEKIEVFTVKSVAELVEISTKENFRDKAVTLWLLSMAFKDPSLKAIEAVLF